MSISHISFACSYFDLQRPVDTNSPTQKHDGVVPISSTATTAVPAFSTDESSFQPSRSPIYPENDRSDQTRARQQQQCSNGTTEITTTAVSQRTPNILKFRHTWPFAGTERTAPTCLPHIQPNAPGNGGRRAC